jgi:hypothetical protein
VAPISRRWTAIGLVKVRIRPCHDGNTLHSNSFNRRSHGSPGWTSSQDLDQLNDQDLLQIFLWDDPIFGDPSGRASRAAASQHPRRENRKGCPFPIFHLDNEARQKVALLVIQRPAAKVSRGTAACPGPGWWFSSPAAAHWEAGQAGHRHRPCHVRQSHGSPGSTTRLAMHRQS